MSVSNEYEYPAAMKIDEGKKKTKVDPNYYSEKKKMENENTSLGKRLLMDIVRVQQFIYTLR